MADRNTFYRLLGLANPPTQSSKPTFVGEARSGEAVIDAATQSAPSRQNTEAIAVTPSIVSLPGQQNVKLVTTDAELARVIPILLQAPLVGLDTETTGLDCLTDSLRLVQLAIADTVYIVDCQRVSPMGLTPFVEHAKMLVGHNLKFDFKFLARAGLPTPDGTRVLDTMLAAQLLGSGSVEGLLNHCGLSAVTKRLLGTELDKSLQTSEWGGSLSDEQLLYAARDAAVLLPLADRLQRDLAAAGLARVAGLEMRALPAVVWLELTGPPFDVGAWADLSDSAVAREIELEQELARAARIPCSKDPSSVDIVVTGKPVNWSSPKQVLRLLQSRGHAIQQTNEATLRQIVEHDPLVKLLLEHREAKRKASTYGIEFVKHVHQETGRIHADYLQIGAASGRMACQRPNLQNIPRDPAYRACFRPAEGRSFVRADYSQVELRIAAELTGDARMREAYLQGFDLHAVTAAAVLGRPSSEVTPEDRQAAKAVNFGLIYGMGAKTLQEYAASNYGVHLTEEEAQTLRRRYFSTYPAIRNWHRGQQDGRIETRTIAGRRRLDVERFTEKLNTPVQGTGADGLKAALALLWETRDHCPTASPVLVVHDEIVVECAVQDAEEVRGWLTKNMEEGMGCFLRHVPVRVDAKVGSNWGEVQ